MLDWARSNWKRLSVLAIGGLLVYLAASPYADRPEVKGVEFVLRGLAVALGVGG